MGERRTRTELEALAFGADATPAERSEALRALGYAAPPAPADLAAAERDDAGSAAAGELGGEPPVPAGLRRRWPLGARIGLGVGLLAVGAVVGFAVGDGRLDPARNLSDSPGPALTTVDRATAGSGPSPTTDAATAAAQADTLLARPRTKEDKYPFPPDQVYDYVTSSTRLELTTADGDRLYVARKSGDDGGYCLLLASGTVETGLSGSGGCVSPTSFGTGGLTMITDTLTVTWSGSSVSLEPGGGTAG